MAGALAGVRIVETAGLGPAPFAAMMLADHGADVIRVERPGVSGGPGTPPETNILLRSRRALTMDINHAQGPGVMRARSPGGRSAGGNSGPA